MKITVKNNSSLFLSDNVQETEHFLSDILPYKTCVKIDSRLNDGLKEYLLIIIAAEQAITELSLGNFASFDPLVGENLCQIRAVKMALAFINCSFNTETLLENIRIAKAKIDDALENFEKIDKKSHSLKSILESENCDVSITPVEKFLIRSFILTKIKIKKPDHLSNPLVNNDATYKNKIKEFSDVGSLFAKNFVNHLRKKLASSSVNFIQEISRQYHPTNPDAKMVSHDFIFDHFGLKCVPCYWASRVALRQAFLHKAPLVLLVNQKATDQAYAIVEKAELYFEATSNGYKITCPTKLNPESPALVIAGNTCREARHLTSKESWINELLQYAPEDLTLTCCAVHRQYPDNSKDHLFSDNSDQNYNHHKQKAHEWGCSLENPSLFLLAHVYCDKIKNIKHS